MTKTIIKLKENSKHLILYMLHSCIIFLALLISNLKDGKTYWWHRIYLLLNNKSKQTFNLLAQIVTRNKEGFRFLKHMLE